jgi:hypothetical protein
MSLTLIVTYLTAAQENLYELFQQVLYEIATDLVTFLPRIVLAVIVLALTFAILKLLNKALRRVLRVIGFDELFRKLAQAELPFSINSLIVALADAGVILLALFSIADLFLEPQGTLLLREALGYGARVVSVIAAVIFTFVIFSVLIVRVRIESRMRGYVIFILLILITAMILDLTALSDSTKQALENGLSLGLGIAVGVFAVWFFFHDYLDKYLKIKKV